MAYNVVTHYICNYAIDFIDYKISTYRKNLNNTTMKKLTFKIPIRKTKKFWTFLKNIIPISYLCDVKENNDGLFSYFEMVVENENQEKTLRVIEKSLNNTKNTVDYLEIKKT